MPTKPTLPSTAVGRRRLLKLAGMLEADARNNRGIKFDLKLWGAIPAFPMFIKPDAIPLDCQTTVCAIGFACISGAFARSGLTYLIRARTGQNGNNIVPRFGRQEGSDAIEEFFALANGQFDFLFTNLRYKSSKGSKTERAVAKRIRQFVAGKAVP